MREITEESLEPPIGYYQDLDSDVLILRGLGGARVDAFSSHSVSLDAAK